MTLWYVHKHAGALPLWPSSEHNNDLMIKTCCSFTGAWFISTQQTKRLDWLCCFFVSQLNGTTVGDVHIKVSIARKQPMLDAATGKSVWASLGKYSTRIVRLDTDQTACVSAQRGLTVTPIFPLQPCRTALKAPTGTKGTKWCTVKIFSWDEKSMFLLLYF